MRERKHRWGVIYHTLENTEMVGAFSVGLKGLRTMQELFCGVEGQLQRAAWWTDARDEAGRPWGG